MYGITIIRLIKHIGKAHEFILFVFIATFTKFEAATKIRFLELILKFSNDFQCIKKLLIKHNHPLDTSLSNTYIII